MLTVSWFLFSYLSSQKKGWMTWVCWPCPTASMLVHIWCQVLYGIYWIYLSNCKKTHNITLVHTYTYTWVCWPCPTASMLVHIWCQVLYGIYWIYLSNCKKTHNITLHWLTEYIHCFDPSTICCQFYTMISNHIMVLAVKQCHGILLLWTCTKVCCVCMYGY